MNIYYWPAYQCVQIHSPSLMPSNMPSWIRYIVPSVLALCPINSDPKTVRNSNKRLILNKTESIVMYGSAVWFLRLSRGIVLHIL